MSVALAYSDDALLVADKPAGMLAVPGRGPEKQDCLATRVQRSFSDALIVHRLDMATSGLLIFARGTTMQRALSAEFRERRIQKNYVALVAGKVPLPFGEISLPLSADWPNRPKQKVDEELGKPSLTRYRVLDYAPNIDVSRLELEPVTGRTHQLRVHMAALGHPIIGDTLYGGRAEHRLMLHACSLQFTHPVTGHVIDIVSATPF